MTPDQQRIAIAEICGWRLVEDNPDFEPYWEDPKGNMIAVGSAMHRLPDYLSDLNAMHEAEETFQDNATLWHKYASIIDKDYVNQPYTIGAAAAQRAEAFLRTVGRWEE
jgi:hypothetical protein